MRHRFFRRNELLVAMSSAVVVVEAPLRSGARNAAQWARRLSKALFVVPAPPWNTRGGGCIAELKLGARPLFNHKDVLRLLEIEAPERATPPRRVTRRPPPDGQLALGALCEAAPEGPAALSAAEKSVIDALRERPCHVDDLSARSGTPIVELASLLLGLELRGFVVSHSAGYYRRA
jgi:DNA processing protein